VPKGLKRYFGSNDLHFITCSCYRRLPFLGTARPRDLFIDCLEQVRNRYQFAVCGYVVMPEHIHLLIAEPQHGNISTVMQVSKQRVARKLLSQRRGSAANGEQQELFRVSAEISPEHFRQTRFYDFNVWTEKKRNEKLRYMHRNPVKRGLVRSPEEWRWSSFRHYALGERGMVLVNAEFAPKWAKAAGGADQLPHKLRLSGAPRD